MDIHVVDAFTDRPFAGNPAAVCVLDGPADAAWMQAVAAEMNLSETAFLHPVGDTWNLRWFTPVAEVDLCGHATLAAAHVLWETGRLAAADAARFDTQSGRLTCRRDGEWIVMDFPRLENRPGTIPGWLPDALGATPSEVLDNAMDKLVAVTDAATVRSLAPDFVGLRNAGVRGVIVTAPGDEPGIDYVCRYFAPAVGIDEDPVTGSIQCALAPYWATRLGRNVLVAKQVSRRGGILRVTLAGDRVLIAGRAVTTLRAELLVAVSVAA